MVSVVSSVKEVVSVDVDGFSVDATSVVVVDSSVVVEVMSTGSIFYKENVLKL